MFFIPLKGQWDFRRIEFIKRESKGEIDFHSIIVLKELNNWGNFIKNAPRFIKLQINASFKSCLKNILRPNFWPKLDKNTPKTYN